jgi:hypothetical protein
MSSAGHPLRLGSLEEFAVLRDFFQRAEFNDTTLCRLLHLENMSDVGRVRWDEIQLETASAALRWCIQFFVRCEPADEQDSRSICGEAVFVALKSLGLLRAAKNNSRMVLCPVWLYPADGFVVVSDRRDDPDGGEYLPPEDVVFPAIYAGTLRFLKLLPEARNADALDHCGGSGIGALRLARLARQAVTADLTERSAFFAEFNGRLNGVRIESLCGDLYAPVAGRQFDLITK